jgi:hypothetical protein
MEVCAVRCTADELDETVKKLNAEGWYIRQVYQEALSHYRIFAKRGALGDAVGEGGEVPARDGAGARPADADGREAEALQVIKDNPKLSLRLIVYKLKELGIKRGRSWVGNKRFEILSG